ncbi:hypothetical protein [Roseateles saccharophilus]|uniref:hypothetical protein n=1 Tax=Roseateles saccharophilus TaxID=304 RepID=UPI002407AAEF|nr:hypothetical protein [Roseateles saccharophilus]
MVAATTGVAASAAVVGLATAACTAGTAIAVVAAVAAGLVGVLAVVDMACVLGPGVAAGGAVAGVVVRDADRILAVGACATVAAVATPLAVLAAAVVLVALLSVLATALALSVTGLICAEATGRPSLLPPPHAANVAHINEAMADGLIEKVVGIMATWLLQWKRHCCGRW